MTAKREKQSEDISWDGFWCLVQVRQLCLARALLYTLLSAVLEGSPDAISMNNVHKTFGAAKGADGEALRAVETTALVTSVVFSGAVYVACEF